MLLKKRGCKGCKKGQLSVFAVIGLIILLTYLALSYYKSEKLEERELILPELIPLQQYVQGCTRNIAREAIEIIGINGGYIYFPPYVQSNPNSYLKLSPVDDLKNPYWWYDGKTSIPPLDFISKQISDYTEERIAGCLDNFSAFHNQYNIIELGKFDVVTEVGDEDVAVKTIYPIEVRDKFNKTLAKLQKFPVTIPVRLKKAYKLAKTIMERENKDYFIEKKAIDLISLDNELPTTGIEVKCGKKRWETKKAESKIKELLSLNLPFIKIKGAKFREDSRIPPYQLQDTNPFSESDNYSDSYYYHHYIWDISDEDYRNMHVSFSYDEKWPMDFYVRPGKGKYLESNPQRAGKLLSLFCLHIWHFTYDVVFPVRVAIIDDKTEQNEGYSFVFAFKAQINHNTPERASFAVETFDTKDTYIEEEYCSDVTNEIIVYAEDKINGMGIRDVNISFTCGRFTCGMGSTRSYWEEESSGIPKLKKKFPYCSNGVLRGSKPGYEDAEMFAGTGRKQGTSEPKGNAFTLQMRAVKEFNFTIVKYNLIGNSVENTGKGAEGASGNEGNLDAISSTTASPVASPAGTSEAAKAATKAEWLEGEQAMVTLNSAEERFESHSTYPPEDSLLSSIKLIDGKDAEYELQIIVMDENSISAGYEGKWAVNEQELMPGKNITFHVVGKDFNKDNKEDEEERYSFFAGLREHSKKVPLPQIK